ncbi:MAG: hypothetical protein FWF02_08170 [Micrococcales bacterium]|nr:hypothetical protein [Micrococcales bacterium]MCL2667666.1 hypothetical protein [Micrococcales bacterium]
MNGLKRFPVDWLGEWRPEYGVPRDEIPEHVPQPLAELYAFAGRWPSPVDLGDGPYLLDCQDHLVELTLADQDGKIYFLDENQGNWDCYVTTGGDDTRVYFNGGYLFDDDYDLNGPDEGYVPLDVSLSHLLTTYALQ